MSPLVRLVAFAVALAGCQPGIGDACETSIDCAASGERLCDITQPGGYCTMFNCEPGTCPEDSKCVLFSARRSTVPGCEDQYGVSPYQRSFCMRTCESDGDCRSEYSCENLGDPANAWGAVVVDGGSGRVCVVPYSTQPLPDRSSEVCTGTEEEFELPPEGGSSAGAGGAGGSDAASAGAGGA